MIPEHELKDLLGYVTGRAVDEHRLSLSTPALDSHAFRHHGRYEAFSEIQKRLEAFLFGTAEPKEPRTAFPPKVRIRVVGSAGVGNDFDEVIEGPYSTASEIWTDARELAVDSLGFGFTALVLCDDGRELDPEEWVAAGRPCASGTKGEG